MAFTTFHVDQMSLVSAISNELTNQNPNLPFEPALYNKIIEAANMVVAECSRERVYSKPGMSPHEWLASDDVGLSSKYMISVLAGLGSPLPNGDTPRDADDLGRCIRMVKACDLESQIPRLLIMGDTWKKIAENWQKLNALYDAGNHKIIYRMLKSWNNLL